MFHLDAAALPPASADFDPFRTADGGVSVWYGSADLEMTVRTLLADPAVAGPNTAGWLKGIADDPASTPERRTIARVGLAALGQPVLAELQARAGAPDLAPRGSLWLGLGLVALGDEPDAAALLRKVEAAAGERHGTLARIAVNGGPDAVADATARFAQLAAAVGDPLAEPALAYVAAHPGRSDLHVTEEFATIRALIAREPAAAAKVAWTVAGVRTVTDLSDGSAATLVLTPAQRATLTLETVAGRLTVVGRWSRHGPPDAVPASSLTLTRSMSPASAIGRTAIVRVRLRFGFEAGSLDGTCQVDELVPSGLAPLDSTQSWESATADGLTCDLPLAVDGQRVQFMATKPDRPGRPLCYFARVVTPGTYTWEPASIWSEDAPQDWARTPADSISIT